MKKRTTGMHSLRMNEGLPTFVMWMYEIKVSKLLPWVFFLTVSLSNSRKTYLNTIIVKDAFQIFYILKVGQAFFSRSDL